MSHASAGHSYQSEINFLTEIVQTVCENPSSTGSKVEEFTLNRMPVHGRAQCTFSQSLAQCNIASLSTSMIFGAVEKNPEPRGYPCKHGENMHRQTVTQAEK